MRNKSGIYKIVAICASVIAALAMLVPTVTSAVGSSTANNSNHNAASATSSATSTRSTSSSSTSSTRSSEQSGNSNKGKWTELKGRNLQWRYGDKKDGGNLCELHLSPVDKTKPVNGNHLLGQDYNGLEHIFSGYQSGSTGLANQIKTIVIDEDMNLSDAEGMFYDFEGVTKITGLQHMRFKGSNDVSLQSMFSKCIRLKELEGIQNWDISKVTNTSFMFTEDKNLKNIDLSGWKTNNKTNMFAMFYNSGVESLNLEKWNFSQDEFQVFYGGDKSRATAGMFQNSGLRDITLPTDKKNENYSTFPGGIWRKSKGKSAVKPGENIDLVDNDYTSKTGYIRWVRDYTKVTFASKVGNAKDPNNTITCVADVLQGKSYTLGENHTLDKNHTLSKNTEFVDCAHKYTPSKDLQLSGKPDDKVADKEKLALQAEDLGLTYTAKLIRESKNSKIDVLENLLKEADNSRYKSAMTFDEIRKSLGIVSDDTVKWQQLLTPIFDDVNFVNKKQIFIKNAGFNGNSKLNVNNDVLKDRANPLDIQDKNIKDAIMHALFDITFTANVTHKQKPTPPVPTPPAPQPQPTPTPTPTPEPGPTPEPAPEPTPTPEPSPEPTPDDSDILPDITPKPDLNINSNNNFVHPFNKAPQSVKGDDVQNNKLQHSEINGRARLGVKEYVGGNSGTCKCVCPNLPKDAKSHKSNKSVRKSSNKAVPCKSGNNYSWLGIGGLIISWLIMLLIGFIVGYKMRKKRDDEQIDENQSAIKDQSL